MCFYRSPTGDLKNKNNQESTHRRRNKKPELEKWAIRLFILIKSNFRYLFSVRFECGRQANRIFKINCERERGRVWTNINEKKSLPAFSSIYHRHQLYLFQLLKRKNRLASMEQFYLSIEIRIVVALLYHPFSWYSPDIQYSFCLFFFVVTRNMCVVRVCLH